MSLDPDDPRPPYQQVANAIRAAITSGTVTPGEKLPSLNELSGRYGVARMTVQQAMRVLRDEGLIVSRQGSGVFVRQRPERPLGLHPPIEQAFTPDAEHQEGAVMGTGALFAPGAGRTRSAVELAQYAGRAIRDLIEVAAPGGDPALLDPASLHRLLDELALLGHRLPQALHQLAAALHHQHDAGHLAIEDGTEFAGDPGRAVGAATAFLEIGEQLAEELGAALDRASRALAHACAAGPEPEQGSRPER